MGTLVTGGNPSVYPPCAGIAPTELLSRIKLSLINSPTALAFFES